MLQARLIFRRGAVDRFYLRATALLFSGGWRFSHSGHDFEPGNGFFKFFVFFSEKGLSFFLCAHSIIMPMEYF